MARETRLTSDDEQIVKALDLDEGGYRRTPSMATKERFPPDYSPIPLFLSDQAGEPEQPGIGKAWHRVSILAAIAAAIVFAVLLVGNPFVRFANATASLVSTSARPSGIGQQFQAWAAKRDARAQAPTIQSTDGAQALPPTAREAPTRDEIAAAFKAGFQNQTEISQPPAEALFKQFQAWAAEQDGRAEVRPAQKQQ